MRRNPLGSSPSDMQTSHPHLTLNRPRASAFPARFTSIPQINVKASYFFELLL